MSLVHLPHPSSRTLRSGDPGPRGLTLGACRLRVPVGLWRAIVRAGATERPNTNESVDRMPTRTPHRPSNLAAIEGSNNTESVERMPLVLPPASSRQGRDGGTNTAESVDRMPTPMPGLPSTRSTKDGMNSSESAQRMLHRSPLRTAFPAISAKSALARPGPLGFMRRCAITGPSGMTGDLHP